MTIETIDGVLYYIWRVGDELPKNSLDIMRQEYEWWSVSTKSWRKGHAGITEWNNVCEDYDRRWPKLLNDSYQHQRMIDEAFENLCFSNHVEMIKEHTQTAEANTKNGSYKDALEHLAFAGAYVKRMMEYVQGEIDKEETK